MATRDGNTLQRFFSEFGADYGRIIGEVPLRWKDEFVREIQVMGLSLAARRKALDQLTRFVKTGVVSRDTRRIGEDAWLERALSQHESLPFNAILTDSEDLSNLQYDYCNMLESAPNDWLIEHTQSVPRNAVSLANSIDLSLKLSKTILFVDPYFDPANDNYRLPFVEFAKRSREGRVLTNRIYVHTCEINDDDPTKRKGRKEILRGMEDCLRPLLPKGLTVELWIWPFAKVHDRFVLTDLVGYAFGHGLSEAQYQGAIEVNVNRLSRTARDEEFRKFSTEANRIGECIEIVGQ